MLTGAHVVVYSKDAEADRTFFKDILGFRSVDAGHGWLIFALPAAEVAFPPSRGKQQA
jgi:catechol 2,3-dioxygenase-like lactoylglutathione lyase family enzyme